MAEKKDSQTASGKIRKAPNPNKRLTPNPKLAKKNSGPIKHSKQAQCQKKCETCEKAGLPILLTRYGVAPKGTYAPKLSGRFSAKDDYATIDVDTDANYTLRLLRTGYVYVYDEALDTMDEYFVTEDSVLSKQFRTNSLGAKPRPVAEFQCARNGNVPVAGCITIPDANKYDRFIWIGYSDGRWSDATFKDLKANQGKRDKSMRKIWVQGGEVLNPHTAKLTASLLKQHVAEFQDKIAGPITSEHLFKGSLPYKSVIAEWNSEPYELSLPFPYNRRHGQEVQLEKDAFNMHDKGGAIVALDDPVGLSAELVGIISTRLEHYAKSPERQRLAKLEARIGAMQGDIQDQAIEAEAMKITKKNERIISQREKGIRIRASLVSNKEAQQILLKEADDAWEPYQEKIDAGTRQAKHQAAHDEAKVFHQTYIDGLVAAYKKWVAADTTAKHFESFYDQQDPASGIAFTEAVTLMAYSHQNHPELAEMMADLMEGDITDIKNHFLRAMVFNQKNCIDIISSTCPARITASPTVTKDTIAQMPWDTVFDVMAQSFGKLDPSLAGDRYLLAISGAVSRLQSKAVDKGLTGLHGWVAKGMMIMKPPIILSVTGSNVDLKQAALASINMRLGNVANSMESYKKHKAVLDIMVPDETVTKNTVLVADPAYVKKMPFNLNARTSIAWMHKHVTTLQQYKDNVLWKAQRGVGKILPANTIKRGLTSATGHGLGVISSIATVVSARSILLDKDGQYKKDAPILRYSRIGAAILSLTNVTADMMSSLFDVLAKKSTRLTRTFSRFASGLSTFGRALGTVAGVLFGLLDMYSGYQDAKNGNAVTGGLVFAIGFGSVAVVFLVAAGLISALWIIAVAIVAIIVTFLIAWFGDNPLQLWLERTLFGTLSAHQYTLNQEEVEYHEALEEMISV